MAKTLAQIQTQIDKLQQQADAIRAREVPSVIQSIKLAILQYGLTADDLGLAATGPTDASKASGRRGGARPGAGRKRGAADGPAAAVTPGKTAARKGTKTAAGKRARGAAKPGRKAARGAKGQIKYRDDQGNAWTGVGTRPKWFLAALAAGKTPEDLQATPPA